MKTLPDDMPAARWHDLCSQNGNVAADPAQHAQDLASIDHYLSDFLPPSPNCPCCEAKLLGSSIVGTMLGLGSFRWGLVHGEGSCTECSWPVRAYHRNVGPFEFFSVLLAYHPKNVTRREETA